MAKALAFNWFFFSPTRVLLKPPPMCDAKVRKLLDEEKIHIPDEILSKSSDCMTMPKLVSSIRLLSARPNPVEEICAMFSIKRNEAQRLLDLFGRLLEDIYCLACRHCFCKLKCSVCVFKAP